MKNTLLHLTIFIFLSLSLSACSKNKTIQPSNNMPFPPIDSMLITYTITIVSVDGSSQTNLVNGMGYAYKSGPNWIRVIKYNSDGNYMPVSAGQVITGLFYVPTGLQDINFQSQLFILNSISGDPANNPLNIANIKVCEDGNVIVDKSPTGTTANSFGWNNFKWDIGALTPLHR